jgi:alpha-acetolactate decarboxylase
VSEASNDAGAPFAVVTAFEPDTDVSIAPVSRFTDLEERYDQFRSSGNIFLPSESTGASSGSGPAR